MTRTRRLRPCTLYIPRTGTVDVAAELQGKSDLTRLSGSIPALQDRSLTPLVGRGCFVAAVLVISASSAGTKFDPKALRSPNRFSCALSERPSCHFSSHNSPALAPAADTLLRQPELLICTWSIWRT